MKVSLIITLKNEERTILELLNSVVKQSKKPDELVIVDGGSTDKTTKIIKNFMCNKKIPTKILIKKNTNISKGRNIAIKNARYNLITVTDGGCRLDKNWLRNITNPFRKDEKLEVVFGLYKVIGKSLIGKCLAGFCNYKTNTQNLATSELSSRSVAFKKTAWKKTGGYPEQLTLAGEDTLFFINLKTQCNWIISRNAIVFWEHNRENLWSIYKMHYRNSIGSGEANMWPLRYLLLLGTYFFVFFVLLMGLRYPVFLLLLILLVPTCLTRGIIYSYRKINSYKVFLIMPVLLFVRDLGMILGYLNGLFNRILNLKNEKKNKQK